MGKKNKKSANSVNIEKQQTQAQENAYKMNLWSEENKKKAVVEYLSLDDLGPEDHKIINSCFKNIANEDIKRQFAEEYCNDTLQELQKTEEEIAEQKKDVESKESELSAEKNNLEKSKQEIATQKSEIEQRNFELKLAETKQNAREAEYKQNIERQVRTEILQETNNTITILREGLISANEEKKALRDENIKVENYKTSAEEAWKKVNELQSDNKKLTEQLEKFKSLKDEISNKIEVLNLKIEQTSDSWTQMAVSAVDNVTANIESFTEKLKKQTEDYKKAKKELEEQIECSEEDIFEGLKNITKPEDSEYYDDEISSLSTFCNAFMVYAQNNKYESLYYDIKTIATFVAGLNSSRLMILEGMSGTGKTSLPRIFARFMGQSKITAVIPVQPSWKDKHDLLGFYNDFSHKFKETEFLKALYTALLDKERMHIIMLDEMNLSRIEYYFADFLSILQLDINDRKIDLLPGGKTSKVLENVNKIYGKTYGDSLYIGGSNIWFVGTANKDDSTFTITDKVYDRASVLRLEKQGVKQENITNRPPQQYKVPIKEIARVFEDVVEKHKFDYDKFMSEIEYVLGKNNIGIGNRIQKQINRFVPTYCECLGKHDEDTIKEAIDIVLRNKVLRKLEIITLEEQIDELKELANTLMNILGENSESFRFVNDKLKNLEN